MGILSRRRSHPLLTALILLLSASAISLPLSDSSRGGGARKVLVGDMQAQALRGLGSSPPTCQSKCGSCSPCGPVHVPVQPGLSMPLEYYPEAWRCKCGNKLFMP